MRVQELLYFNARSERDLIRVIRVIRGCLHMKKIGILFGQEHSFPPAFVERVNQKTGGKDIAAEFVRIDRVIQGEPCGYDVVIDRISQDVPFYRAWLKNAALTGTAVVNKLQDEVKFDMYFRCHSIDQRHVRIMPYEPRHPFHLRYQTEWHAPKEILQKVEEGVLRLNEYLGYDLNTVEFAIRDGVPVAIDFCNPAPDCEAAWIGQENFEWVVEAISEMVIRKAREHVAGRDNLSWGKFVQAAVTRRSLGDLA